MGTPVSFLPSFDIGFIFGLINTSYIKFTFQIPFGILFKFLYKMTVPVESNWKQKKISAAHGYSGKTLRMPRQQVTRRTLPAALQTACQNTCRSTKLFKIRSARRQRCAPPAPFRGWHILCRPYLSKVSFVCQFPDVKKQFFYLILFFNNSKNGLHFIVKKIRVIARLCLTSANLGWFVYKSPMTNIRSGAFITVGSKQ
jgi:hypothetical protein